MRFRLTTRSITLDDHEHGHPRLSIDQGRILSEFHRISQIWESTTAK